MRIYFLLVLLCLNSLNLCAQITEDSLETFTAACIDGIDNDGDGLTVWYNTGPMYYVSVCLL
jgi:hypothetical protein